MPELQRDANTRGGVRGAYKCEGNRKFRYLYVPANANKGEVYQVVYDGDEAKNPKLTTPSTTSVEHKIAVVPEDQGSSAGFQWCQVEGDCPAADVDGTTDVSQGDYLEAKNSNNNFEKSGTSKTKYTAAIANEARTADSVGHIKVYLTGERVECQA